MFCLRPLSEAPRIPPFLYILLHPRIGFRSNVMLSSDARDICIETIVENDNSIIIVMSASFV